MLPQVLCTSCTIVMINKYADIIWNSIDLLFNHTLETFWPRQRRNRFVLGQHIKDMIHICIYYIVNFCLICALHKSYSLLANSRVGGCRTGDLMPNVSISCLPPSRLDPEVQGLKVIIDCPQPGSSRATCRPPPPISRWSKCDGNDTVMVLIGSGTSKVPKETQPEWLDPAGYLYKYTYLFIYLLTYWITHSFCLHISTSQNSTK